LELFLIKVSTSLALERAGKVLPLFPKILPLNYFYVLLGFNISSLKIYFKPGCTRFEFQTHNKLADS